MSDVEKGIIQEEEPQQCDYCGKIRELRPYGKDGASICFECAMNPTNVETTKAVFEDKMSRAPDTMFVIPKRGR